MAMLLLPSAALTAAGAPAEAPEAEAPAPGVIFPSVMKVGLYAISVSNFNFATGTYTMDVYITFGWANHSFDSPHFEVMNGQPAYSQAISLVYENKTGDMWVMKYRARLDLFVTPDYQAYPFDDENLVVIIEEGRYPLEELVYEWWPEQSGVDNLFSITGWRVGGFQNETEYKEYPDGQAFARLTVGVVMVRDSATGVVQSLLPPMIFCIVSGLAFLFTENKEGTIALRLGLGTSMVITAVMFYFSQMSSLPPANQMKLLDIYMLSVYVFLAMSLVVTALIYHHATNLNRPERISRLNRIGFAASVLVPAGVFIVLATLCL
jgi:hypothetical protein